MTDVVDTDERAFAALVAKKIRTVRRARDAA
jgi:hypothetical protein